MKGHIRQRSPGHWAIIIEVRDPATGQRKRRWHSVRGNKREAEVERARLITDGGATVDPSKITVAAFLDRFERDWVDVHVSAASAARYRDALGRVRQHLGNVQLQKVRPADIAAFYATLSRTGLAARTIRLIHNVLHRALGQAKAWDVIRDNPADRARAPKIPDQETPMLQPDQARELLERLRGHSLYTFAALALHIGARRNESLALRWRDIDLDASKITIEQSLEQTRAFGIRVKEPKTRKARRTTSLPAAAVEALRAHWRAQQEQRLALGLGRSPAESPVFANLEGQFLSPNAITKAWPA